MKDVVGGRLEGLGEAGGGREALEKLLLKGVMKELDVLLATIVEEEARLPDRIDIGLDELPDLLNALAEEGGTNGDLDGYLRGRQGVELEGIAKMLCSHLCGGGVDVGLVDNDEVGEFHDAALDALELVAEVGRLEEEEAVDHGVGFDLGLTDAYCLDDDGVEASGLAKEDGLAGGAGDASEGTRGGGRADEGLRMGREERHARLVGEDAAARALAGGVDGEDRDTMALSDEKAAERLDEGALAGARDAGDAKADGTATVGEALLDDLLGKGGVLGERALEEGDGTGERSAVGRKDALNKLLGRRLDVRLRTQLLEVKIINLRRLMDPFLDIEGAVVIKI